MFVFQCCENLPLVSIESFVPTLNPFKNIPAELCIVQWDSQDDNTEDLSQVNEFAASPSISNLQSLQPSNLEVADSP